jgi:hypothetical protein
VILKQIKKAATARSLGELYAHAFVCTYYEVKLIGGGIRVTPIPPPSGVVFTSFTPSTGPGDSLVAGIPLYVQVIAGFVRAAGGRPGAAALDLYETLQRKPQGSTDRLRAAQRKALGVILEHNMTLEHDEWRRRCQAAAR